MPGPHLSTNSEARVSSQDRRVRHVYLTTSALIVFLAMVATVGTVYFRVFSGFAPYDDEGYLMLTVRSFLDGYKLFDQIYTLYGPFYYLFQWGLHGLIELAVSNDVARWTTLVLWVTSSVLLSWCAYRLTRSLPIALLALLETTKLLALFADSPGHPQEICTLIAAALLLVMLQSGVRVSWPTVVIAVALVTAAAWTKVNVGLYSGLTVVLAAFAGARTGSKRKLLYMGVVAASFLLIVAIMSPLLYLKWALMYCLWMLLTLASMTITAPLAGSEVELPKRTVLIAAVSAIVVTLAITVPFLLLGTTLHAMLYMTLFQHRDFVRHWFRPSPFSARSVVVAAASFFLALSWVLANRKANLNDRAVFGLQMLKGVIGVVALYAATFLDANTIVLGTYIMKVAAPFGWLVVVPPTGAMGEGQRFWRVALGFLQALFCMYAFPVSGAQSQFAAVPVILTACVFIHDGCAAISARLPNSVRLKTRRLAWSGAVCLCAVLFFRQLRAFHRLYVRWEALNLPGSERIHVDPELGRALRSAAQDAEKCTSFFTMPGMYSFYFWTHQAPPTTLNMNDWPAFFNAQQQQQMLSELRQKNTSCVIYNPEMVEFMRAGQDLSASPLARYVQKQFTPVANRHGYYFMVRK